MSDTLHRRAKTFVALPVPAELDYVPGSMAERIIAAYAREGGLEADDELAELIELCVMESSAAAEARADGPAKAYLTESAAILSMIAAELSR